MPEVALRKEQEIFDDLASLCRSPGYIYALAALCFRDTVVGFADEMKAEDMANMFSMDRLIRTELTTLMGLVMRGPIDFICPSQSTVFSYLQQSEELLAELHQAILLPPEEFFDMAKVADPTYNPFANAASLREPIFYGAESAYTFQYRDFAAQKYAKDAAWLVSNRGIDISTASVLVKALTDLLNASLTEIWHRLPTDPMPHQTLLDGFTFTSADLSEKSGVSHASVKAFLDAFTAPELDANPGFITLASFNAAYAFPLIRRSADQYILLQHYGITEAIYETPFYWMGADKAYMPIAFEHRGDFTEDFSFDRLSSVFGADRVFKNVEIFRAGSSDALGEIDVLVLFGDQAIVLQCKSKKLTLKARHGNDLQLREDFKAAVQDAVDQAMDCSRWLKDVSTVLRCLDGTKVVLNRRPTTIYPISVVSDHYPALTFQAKQFLEASPEEGILPPLAFDIFALDAIAEMLDSPLRLLSYLRLRTKFDGSFNMSHEHIILGYHLRLNLWRQSDIDMIWVADDFAASLDIAMAARRDGVPGARTPDGILTRFAGTHFARLIAEMEQLPDRVALDIGFFLLELSEETVLEFNNGVEAAFRMTAADGRHHDFTIGVSEASAGLSVHVSNDDVSVVESRLHRHCTTRKYRERAADWFGIALHPDGSIKLAAVLTGAWKFDQDMQTYVNGLLPAPAVEKSRVPKVGRNDPCPCRSGKKFKKCHGR